ncbi:MAG: type II secretion system protein GspN [Deltaproteobacteria bacterium]|nr:type II secretion system protein GspN [Deltaproteobacteria bacterium]
MPKPLKYIFYIALFFFSFCFFVYWMLPMHAVKTRIIGGVEEALGPAYEVKIGTLKTSWLTGVLIRDFSIANLESGKPLPLFKADRLKIRVGLFSLLFGGPRISIDAKTGKAIIEGVLHKSDQGVSFDGSFDDLDLGQIPLMRQMTGLNLSSLVDGTVVVDYDAKQPLKTTGKMDVAINNLLLKASEVSLGEMGSFPLPDLNIGKGGSVIKASIEKGAITLEPLRIQGDDVNVALTGKIFLAPMVSRYRMNLQGNFQFSPKLWGVIDPILPAQWLEELKKQKGTNDHFPLSISGQFASPQIYSGAVAIYPFKPF